MTYLKRPDFSATLGPAWLILAALTLVACAGVSGCTGGGFFRGLHSLSTGEFVKEERNLEDEINGLKVTRDNNVKKTQLMSEEQRRLAESIAGKRRELSQLRRELGSVAARAPARGAEIDKMQRGADETLNRRPANDQAELDDLVKTIDSMDRLVREIVQERPDG